MVKIRQPRRSAARGELASPTVEHARPPAGGPPLAVALATTFAVAAAWAALLAYRFFHFGYYDWDLAFFAQAMHNLAHGSTRSSIFGINYFANHANFVSLLLLPVWFAAPHPLTLVGLKILSVCGAGWIVYVVARDMLGGLAAYLVLLLFLAYPPNLFGVLYEFDMESVAPALLAGMFYCFLKDRWRVFAALAVVTILVKENLPLVVAGFGVLGLWKKHDRVRWGLAPIVAGLASFWLLAAVVVPWFANGEMSGNHQYIAHYGHWGNALGGALGAILSDPWGAIRWIFLPADYPWFIDTAGVFLFAPFLAAPEMIPACPLILQHLLSSVGNEHKIFFAYLLPIAPFIFFGLVHALAFVRRRAPRLVLPALLVATALVGIRVGHHWDGLRTRYLPEYASQWSSARSELMARVPAGAPVIAAKPFLARMWDRSDLYPFYKVFAPEHNAPGAEFVVPDNVRFALLDDSDGWYVRALEKDEYGVRARVDRFVRRGGWRETARSGPIRLLER